MLELFKDHVHIEICSNMVMRACHKIFYFKSLHCYEFSLVDFVLLAQLTSCSIGITNTYNIILCVFTQK